MKKKKIIKITGITLGALFAVSLAGLAITGWQIGWGPFAFLFKGYGSEVSAIEKKYDAKTRQGEIVFYGASNFRLWTEMENDLSDYTVQNHAFGGSTDKMLVEFADRILYPYAPDIVFFQTGSNDYVSLSGTDEEKAASCMEYKRYMFDTFHEKLPDAKFVVMSGLLLPGRSQYTELTQEVNRQLKDLCDGRDYMFFVDASDLTFDGSNYAEDLFQSDGIHLNHEGQLLWMEGYIKPMIEELIEAYDLSHLRKEG